MCLSCLLKILFTQLLSFLYELISILQRLLRNPSSFTLPFLLNSKNETSLILISGTLMDILSDTKNYIVSEFDAIRLYFLTSVFQRFSLIRKYKLKNPLQIKSNHQFNTFIKLTALFIILNFQNQFICCEIHK